MPSGPRSRQCEQRFSISAAIPIGQSEIHVGYDRSRLKSSAGGINDFTNSVWQAKATYLYNLSKRTALYTTIAQFDNGDRSQNTLASGTSQTAPPVRGSTSKGFELGMRHFF